MRLGWLLLFTLTNFAVALDHKYLVLGGTYTDSGSKGIYSFHFDAGKGTVTSPELAAVSENPSFLAVDRAHRFLYAANEIEKFHGKSDGSISVFSVDTKHAKLMPVQQVSSGGWGPVFVWLDQPERHLFVANYGAGSVAVLRVGKDGQLETQPFVVEHKGTKEHPPRPHAVLTSRDDRFVLVPDLGLNKLFVYRFDATAGTLSADDTLSIQLDSSPGPRHLVVSPSGKFVYLANETNSTVTVFSWDAQSGRLREQQTISTISKDLTIPNTAAEIEIDPQGKSLYVSNRGEDSIVLFKVNENDGKLSVVERVSSGGKTPRTFVIDPTGNWMFVANQESNTINLFQRDPKTGRLTPTSTSLPIAAPAHLLFVPSR